MTELAVIEGSKKLEGKGKFVEIYGLHDPDTGELRYIGKADNTAKRLKSHILDRKLNRPVCRWIKSLVEKGKVPVVEILDVVPSERWETAEREMIAQYRLTANLLNVADGGAMPSCTKEHRQKLAGELNKRNSSKSQEWRNFIKAKQDLARLHTNLQKEGEFFLAYKIRFMMRLAYFDKPELYSSWAAL